MLLLKCQKNLCESR
jgi:hypothetical protein